MSDSYIVLPCFSLEPNKLSTFNRVFSPSQLSSDGYTLPKKRTVNRVKQSFHNFNISENAYRTLKRKVNWLYYLAKPKHVKTYNGKDIFNFKCAFITLTLPSKQKTCTSDVTKRLFNQFLTEVRQRVQIANYVWRLEFQKNGNVHYHIVTDVYLDFFFIQKIWNRILSKEGYIREYTNKFKNLSLSQYNQLTNQGHKTDFSIIAKRYAKGCSQKWEQPNTVDVISVVNKKNIANYISKYFGKDAKHKIICNELDNEENSKGLRLWFCSRGLSKLNSVTDFCEAVVVDWFALISNIKKVRQFVAKYARMFYFDFANCNKFELILIHNTLKDYAKKQGYSFRL